MAESKKVALKFSATGGKGLHAGIGERLPVAPEDQVTVRLEVKGAPACTVRFVTDQGVLFTAPLPESGTGRRSGGRQPRTRRTYARRSATRW